MAQPDPSQLDASRPAGEVLAQLDGRLRQLVIANQVLFQGHWDDLAEDLRRRQAGRPYLFRLDLGLDEPLVWIGRLRDYELSRHEHLADAIPA
jgi:hypothetical protein